MRQALGKLLAVGLFLFCTQSTFAQPPKWVVGDAPSPEVKAAARQTVAQDGPKKLQLEVGEFFIVPHKDASFLTWQICPDSEGNYDQASMSYAGMIKLAANQQIELVGRKMGDTEYKLHTIKEPNPVTVVIGYKPGRAVWQVWKGVKDAAPLMTDTIVLGVGAPPPIVPPVIIPTDPLFATLKRAFDLDTVAGKGSKPVVAQLAGIFNAAADDPLTDYKTLGEVFEKLLLPSAAKLSIPEPGIMLTTLRDTVANELLSATSANPGDYSKPLTDKLRTDLKTAMKRVATVLLTISK